VTEGLMNVLKISVKDGKSCEKILNVGDIVDIPQCCPHQVEALEKSVIVEISSTHHDFDSYRVEKGCTQKGK